MSQRQRATKTEYFERVHTAQQLLVLGGAYSDIVRALVHQYGIDERTAQRYITAARKALRIDPASYQDMTALALAQAAKVYQKALAENELNTALHALRMQQRLRKEHLQFEQFKPKQSQSADLPDALEQALSDLTEPGESATTPGR